MKKFRFPAMLALVAVVAGVVAFAGVKNYPTEPASFSVSGDSIMVAAPREETARDWVNGQDCRNGTMVRSTNNNDYVYWNATSLTNIVASTNMPDHIRNDVAYNGGTTVWRRIPPVQRVGVVIANQSTNEVWLSIGYPAVTNAGIYLAGRATFWVDGNTMQEGVYAVALPTVTNVVTTQEW